MGDHQRSRMSPAVFFILPWVGWVLWFLLIPLSIVLVYSFAIKGTYGRVLFNLSFVNYLRATDWLYLKIFWNSLSLAMVTTLSCLMIGYPMAYIMARASRSIRSVLLILVVIPFWTNFVVRAYAVKMMLGEFGPLNQVLLKLGWIHEPMLWTNSGAAVTIGMITNYLPFMILPLYVTLEKFDFTLLEAAKDLGAPSWKALWRVLFPLTRQGMVSGSIFVFAPALGEFVIPDVLGGAKTMLVGNLITEQFLKSRDWPFGSALSLLLIVVVMLSLLIYLRSEALGSTE